MTIGAAELGSELGKVIFEQILKLGQTAAEDYVKDFFKGCLKAGITSAQPEVTKRAVAGALKAFLVVVADELEDQDLSKAEIRDRYDPALIQFVQDEAVKPLLGKAFEPDCAAIDAEALATVWQRSCRRGRPFPVLPAEFDWQQVGSKYLKKVRRILRETPELRALLETNLLEQIAQNTAQISPGFDVAKYRESLQCSYGHLKLYAIDSTDRGDVIKLWNMFIEQTVREALPPTRYELPLDLKRQLQAQGQLEADLSADALAQYRSEYFQQPSRKVLEVLARSPLALEKGGTGIQSAPFMGDSGGKLAVILGDPGAGKSTLLQYLALEWAEGKTATLPLLIELRDYALAQVDGFLEFLHRGRGADWQFDQQQLHQYLQSDSTLVMFDGLDEVFERSTQLAIIDDMIRFAQQYPKAQIIITSRIIGYNPERLQHANFRHFTIQPLNTDEIHEFIDRWYRLALGNDPDKPRLVTRLKEAIANSNAIQNLADNPLLLTMMAILNRRQELPRDRADLYDHASRVLLYHWDVDHKRLQLPMDTIGRREKQEMLRLIAYEMQAGEQGLQGNLISAERLTRILTDYLREQGFSEPREKANGLIGQLRHRNWILCDRGADTYGFVHRTFLEYFCATEIVHRFEKSRTLTFEQLRDEVFGQNWQDETWHEVLRLICGMIDAKFAGQLIEFLMVRKADDAENDLFSEREIRGLLLATQCLIEVKNPNSVTTTSARLLETIKRKIEDQSIERITFEAAIQMAQIVAIAWSEDKHVLSWLQTCLNASSETSSWWISYFAVTSIVRGWRNSIDVLPFLKSIAQRKDDSMAAQAAVEELARHWRNDPDILPILKNLLTQSNENTDVRRASVRELVRHWKDDPDTLPILRNLSHQEETRGVQIEALRELSRDWSDNSDTLLILKDLVQKEDNSNLRWNSLCIITEYWKGAPEITEFLCQVATNDSFERKKHWEGNPRQEALRTLLTHYPTYPKTLELLRDRAANDPDEQLRQWARERLSEFQLQRNGGDC